ncbi:DUF6252 family protein [Psychroserpens algicola]|uniref:DUF6252 family protein n=1 Tax=Psychroserpens algicola TaxID=1719034 RepID=A0ABT0H4J4_9FLAO|nr:DUF6252 family protein [Psychroserpens algicola]MCK8479296.1 DUF6252 family protein [Psychroserpens algicola]
MKRLAVLFITVLTLVSCGDEVEFNSPAFQGNRNEVLWKAEFTNASIDENGYLTINAGNNVETVSLTIPSVAVGTYILGDVNSMEGRYVDANGTVYSTNNRPDPTVSIYPEYGFVKLDEINNNTFTGSFEFNAFDESGLNVINFGGITEQDPITGGIFYRVPLVSGSIPAVVITCDDTEEIALEARANWLASFDPSLEYIDQDTYQSTCNTYREALRVQRDYCGDLDGELQQAIDELNVCPFRCTFATQNRNTAQAAIEAATIANYAVACDNYRFYLEQQLETCGDDDGSIQLALDNLDCGDDDNDGVPNAFEDFDGDGDLTNDDTDNDGIANYLDDDDDGDGVLTIDEAKDADGNPIDTDGDTDVDYLDNDDDGDGLFTQFEPGDTDGDGIPNYLDTDDDDDTILTINENADPNLDGDPADALDTDMDGLPDYLDDM